METVIVATAQQQLRLFASPEDGRREFSRFMQVAASKGAQVIVFPALAGILTTSPLLDGFRVRLLRQATRKRGRATFADRTRRALAGSTADLLKANFRQPYQALLTGEPQVVGDAYVATFQDLARTYAMTVVAGSSYVPTVDGYIRHSAFVFGPDGAHLGRHDAVLLSPRESGWVQPGAGWTVIETPVGRLGLVFGDEALYPEVGRSLMAQGAELIAVLTAASDQVLASEVRLAAIARAQENRCYVLTSFAVGPDHLALQDEAQPILVGKSGIYAPVELTPRFGGVLVEMGTSSTEGLLTVEASGAALDELRERRPLRLDEITPAPVALLTSGAPTEPALDEMGVETEDTAENEE